MDISGSIELDDGFNIELKFLQTMLHGLNFNFGYTRVGYVTFYSNATSRVFLDTYISEFAKRDLLHAVTIDRVGHQTNISSGLEEALMNQFVSINGDRIGVDNVLILLSDGHLTIETPENALQMASNVKQGGIDIYSVAIGPGPNSGLLLDIGGSSDHYIAVPTASDVAERANDLLDLLC